ncbi:PREDICTED: olfactory receptor 5V1-like [Nanorana parkeri]|uniref:olfactory receptor 5V1-like n=1 Tax=Nanorana parkeri TaxID=125878 RepID=UPI0008550053|nr:PREDICTED: olfactory receptor 5V1-like [Nanorana parkeri]
MDANNTVVTEFILLGFSKLGESQFFLFPLFLLMYVVTVGGNMCIIITYNLNPNLHSPMYFFLGNFSFLEILYVTSTVPNLLPNLLSDQKRISFYGCATQMYCTLTFGGTECYLLAAMAYDRYNAICRPLLYPVIMNRETCIKHIVGSWSIGAVNALIHTTLTFSLPFCKSNQINHFFCDVPPLLQLSCRNTWINECTIFGVVSCVVIASFILTMFSYLQIISTILQMHSSSGRRKTFSTCFSHLIVVTIFYGSGIFMYFRPKSSYGMDQEQVVSLMYTVIAPLLNPFIYTLRNREVKLGIKKILHL